MCQTTVIFGITKDGSLVSNTLASWNCFTCRNLFQNGANDMSECLTRETAFYKKKKKKKKIKILYSSDHPILIKFRQLVVNIVIEELQMVFLTSTVINSNGNMKELERKIKVWKVNVSIGYFILPLQMLTSEVWNVICNSLISVCATG